MSAPEKNWNDLPVELKIMCIERMSFLTRWNLRGTAQFEKQLVDSQKMFIAKVSISTYCRHENCVRISVAFGTFACLFPKNFYAENAELARSVLGRLLHNGVIERFEIYNVDGSSAQKKMLGDGIAGIPTATPFRIKELYIEKFRYKYEPFINNCLLEEIELKCRKRHHLTCDYFYPMAVKYPSVSLDDLDETDSDVFNRVIANWLENDKPLDSMLCATHYVIIDYSIDCIIDGFEERICKRGVGKRGEFVRLKMDDPKKHIMIDMRDFMENTQVLLQVVEDDYKRSRN